MKKFIYRVLNFVRLYTKGQVQRYVNTYYVKGVKDVIDNMYKMVSELDGKDSQEWIDIVYKSIKESKENIDNQYGNL